MTAHFYSFNFSIFLSFFKTQNRMKLMADNYEDDHLKTAPDHANHKPSPDQVLPVGTQVSFSLQQFL